MGCGVSSSTQRVTNSQEIVFVRSYSAPNLYKLQLSNHGIGQYQSFRSIVPETEVVKKVRTRSVKGKRHVLKEEDMPPLHSKPQMNTDRRGSFHSFGPIFSPLRNSEIKGSSRRDKNVPMSKFSLQKPFTINLLKSPSIEIQELSKDLDNSGRYQKSNFEGKNAEPKYESSDKDHLKLQLQSSQSQAHSTIPRLEDDNSVNKTVKKFQITTGNTPKRRRSFERTRSSAPLNLLNHGLIIPQCADPSIIDNKTSIEATPIQADQMHLSKRGFCTMVTHEKTIAERSIVYPKPYRRVNFFETVIKGFEKTDHEEREQVEPSGKHSKSNRPLKANSKTESIQFSQSAFKMVETISTTPVLQLGREGKISNAIMGETITENHSQSSFVPNSSEKGGSSKKTPSSLPLNRSASNKNLVDSRDSRASEKQKIIILKDLNNKLKKNARSSAIIIGQVDKKEILNISSINESQNQFRNEQRDTSLNEALTKRSLTHQLNHGELYKLRRQEIRQSTSRNKQGGVSTPLSSLSKFSTSKTPEIPSLKPLPLSARPQLNSSSSSIYYTASSSRNCIVHVNLSNNNTTTSLYKV